MADEIYIAKEQTSQEIKTILGKPNDTGGDSVAGSVMAKLNKVLTTNLDEEFLALNSTIGTEKEKPLDFFSKNVLMNDGYYYRPVIKYSLNKQQTSIGGGQQYIHGSYMDFNEKYNLIYTLLKNEDTDAYYPAAYYQNGISNAPAVKRTTECYTLSTNVLRGIVCDKTDDSVYYSGVMTGIYAGESRIYKYSFNFGTLLASVKTQNVESQILVDSDYVYDLYGGVIKKYNKSLGLVSTVTIAGVSGFETCMIDGDYLYATGAYNNFAGSLLKIRLSDLTIVSYINGDQNTTGRYIDMTLDQQYLYTIASQKNPTTLVYEYKIRKLLKDNLTIVGVSETTGYNFAASSRNTRQTGLIKDTAYFMVYGGSRIIAVDTATLYFQAISPDSAGIIKGLATTKNDKIFVYNVSSHLAQSVQAFVSDGSYERVGD